MPPRKKAAPADADSTATRDPLVTRTVRSSTRLASQVAAVKANSDSTTDETTFSKPASKVKTKAAPIPKPVSKTTKPASKAKSKRTKADAGADEDHDAPTPKKPKTAAIEEEEEEEVMDADTKDDKKDNKKMVTLPLCHRFNHSHQLTFTSRSPCSSVAQLPLILLPGWLVSVKQRPFGLPMLMSEGLQSPIKCTSVMGKSGMRPSTKPICPRTRTST